MRKTSIQDNSAWLVGEAPVRLLLNNNPPQLAILHLGYFAVAFLLDDGLQYSAEIAVADDEQRLAFVRFFYQSEEGPGAGGYLFGVLHRLVQRGAGYAHSGQVAHVALAQERGVDGGGVAALQHDGGGVLAALKVAAQYGVEVHRRHFPVACLCLLLAPQAEVARALSLEDAGGVLFGFAVAQEVEGGGGGVRFFLHGVHGLIRCSDGANIIFLSAIRKFLVI